jgi:hypothetical protein
LIKIYLLVFIGDVEQQTDTTSVRDFGIKKKIQNFDLDFKMD